MDPLSSYLSRYLQPYLVASSASSLCLSFPPYRICLHDVSMGGDGVIGGAMGVLVKGWKKVGGRAKVEKGVGGRGWVKASCLEVMLVPQEEKDGQGDANGGNQSPASPTSGSSPMNYAKLGLDVLRKLDIEVDKVTYGDLAAFKVKGGGLKVSSLAASGVLGAGGYGYNIGRSSGKYHTKTSSVSYSSLFDFFLSIESCSLPFMDSTLRPSSVEVRGGLRLHTRKKADKSPLAVNEFLDVYLAIGLHKTLECTLTPSLIRYLIRESTTKLEEDVPNLGRRQEAPTTSTRVALSVTSPNTHVMLSKDAPGELGGGSALPSLADLRLLNTTFDLVSHDGHWLADKDLLTIQLSSNSGTFSLYDLYVTLSPTLQPPSNGLGYVLENEPVTPNPPICLSYKYVSTGLKCRHAVGAGDIECYKATGPEDIAELFRLQGERLAKESSGRVPIIVPALSSITALLTKFSFSTLAASTTVRAEASNLFFSHEEDFKRTSSLFTEVGATPKKILKINWQAFPGSSKDASWESLNPSGREIGLSFDELCLSVSTADRIVFHKGYLRRVAAPSTPVCGWKLNLSHVVAGIEDIGNLENLLSTLLGGQEAPSPESEQGADQNFNLLSVLSISVASTSTISSPLFKFKLLKCDLSLDSFSQQNFSVGFALPSTLVKNVRVVRFVARGAQFIFERGGTALGFVSLGEGRQEQQHIDFYMMLWVEEAHLLFFRPHYLIEFVTARTSNSVETFITCTSAPSPNAGSTKLRIEQSELIKNKDFACIKVAGIFSDVVVDLPTPNQQNIGSLALTLTDLATIMSTTKPAGGNITPTSQKTRTQTCLLFLTINSAVVTVSKIRANIKKAHISYLDLAPIKAFSNPFKVAPDGTNVNFPSMLSGRPDQSFRAEMTISVTTTLGFIIDEAPYSFQIESGGLKATAFKLGFNLRQGDILILEEVSPSYLVLARA